MRKFWSQLVRQIQLGKTVFLALVADCTKGSPGSTGAKMFVSDTGDIVGTIGGGAMEFDLIERAQKSLKRGDFVAEIEVLFHRNSGSGHLSGMICGGSQTNLYYICRPQSDRAILEEAVELINRQVSGSLFIAPTGMSVAEKPLVLTQPQIQLTQSAEGWVYEEQLLNRKRIAIVGGGHCSLALSEVMARIGYEVLVIDTRSQVETLTQNVFAQSVKVLQDFLEAGDFIPFPELTAVIVITSNFSSDVEALLGILSIPFWFVGLMGSPAKIARIFQELRQSGISGTDLSHIYAPVGLPIGSRTPEEIAISIAAQILQERKHD